jgi:hypothetical protein
MKNDGMCFENEDQKIEKENGWKIIIEIGYWYHTKNVWKLR